MSDAIRRTITRADRAVPRVEEGSYVETLRGVYWIVERRREGAQVELDLLAWEGHRIPPGTVVESLGSR